MQRVTDGQVAGVDPPVIGVVPERVMLRRVQRGGITGLRVADTDLAEVAVLVEMQRDHGAPT
jgi:hypothetical protein